MVMGVAEDQFVASRSPDLTGARVLITGLEPGHGVDIARAFAEAGCRIVVQTPALDSTLEVLLETLVRHAQEVNVTEGPIRDESAALKCAQSAASVYGGLDAVINLARLDDTGLKPDATEAEIEGRLIATLGGPLLITRVIANRMHLTWREGLILNIVTQHAPTTPAAELLGQIARTALATLTRREAERWAEKSVRVNAIVPALEPSSLPGEITAGLHSEPDIAALALRLCGPHGKTMSGMMFDAALA